MGEYADVSEGEETKEFASIDVDVNVIAVVIVIEAAVGLGRLISREGVSGSGGE